MNREMMVEQLHKGVCKVVFEKKDGNVREMHCTLHPDRLPERQVLTEGDRTPTNPDTIRVFDTDLNEWRSFRVDSVDSFTTPQLLI